MGNGGAGGKGGAGVTGSLEVSGDTVTVTVTGGAGGNGGDGDSPGAGGDGGAGVNGSVALGCGTAFVDGAALAGGITVTGGSGNGDGAAYGGSVTVADGCLYKAEGTDLYPAGAISDASALGGKTLIPVLKIVGPSTTKFTLPHGYTTGPTLVVGLQGRSSFSASRQWCSNTTDTILTATSIDGATADNYAVPSGLAAGDHYFFFEAEDSVYGGATAYLCAAKVTVEAEPTPVTYSVALIGGRNATASGGAVKQTVDKGSAMTAVTYTAERGYHFEENNFDLAGVTVKWKNKTTVVVSGTPESDVNIPVPDAVKDASGDGGHTRPERPDRDDTPTTPAAPTTNVSGGDNTLTISVTVDGGKVTVSPLTNNQIKDVAASDQPVVIDLSSLGKDVTSVSIPADTFVKLAEALAQRPAGADRTVTIETAVGGVTFDAGALAAIAAGAKNGVFTMDFALTGYEQLSPTQQAAFEGQQVMGSFALSMLVNGAAVSSLDGGHLVVSMPFTPAPGTDGRFYKVWFVADNGAKERMPSAFADDTLSVELPHCSDYVLVYEDQIPVPKQVVLSPQKITVNGVEASVEAYNIDGTNYFKLRDLAALLKGTPAQCSVDYDASRNAVLMTRGAAYDGATAAQFTDKSATTVPSPQTVELDGKDVSFTAYNIGGNNFFGLRELSAFLGYSVDYDEAANTAIIESK